MRGFVLIFVGTLTIMNMQDLSIYATALVGGASRWFGLVRRRSQCFWRRRRRRRFHLPDCGRGLHSQVRALPACIPGRIWTCVYPVMHWNVYPFTAKTTRNWEFGSSNADDGLGSIDEYSFAYVPCSGSVDVVSITRRGV